MHKINIKIGRWRRKLSRQRWRLLASTGCVWLRQMITETWANTHRTEWMLLNIVRCCRVFLFSPRIIRAGLLFSGSLRANTFARVSLSARRPLAIANFADKCGFCAMVCSGFRLASNLIIISAQLCCSPRVLNGNVRQWFAAAAIADLCGVRMLMGAGL